MRGGRGGRGGDGVEGRGWRGGRRGEMRRWISVRFVESTMYKFVVIRFCVCILCDLWCRMFVVRVCVCVVCVYV